MTAETQQWTKIIQPRRGWFDIRLSELWRYRDLIQLFVWRDFVKVYKQTILGPLWYLIQPILTTIVFTVIFGRIAQMSTDGLPHTLFYMSGTVVWSYFANCFSKTSDTFIENAPIFGKIYFPRLTVPLSIIISNLIALGLQFLCFLVILGYYVTRGTPLAITRWLIYVPFLIVHMAALGLGVGIIVSSLTTKYRDLRFLTTFGVQLWMYATPIVYPLSAVPERWRWLVALNPMAPIVEIFRYAFLGAGKVDIFQLGSSIGITAMILVIGILLFTRIEKSFMDTV
ncbi:MAG: ABC transporter permease [bacterium]|nr:ABC transporter permease [bacterium]